MARFYGDYAEEITLISGGHSLETAGRIPYVGLDLPRITHVDLTTISSNDFTFPTEISDLEYKLNKSIKLNEMMVELLDKELLKRAAKKTIKELRDY